MQHTFSNKWDHRFLNLAREISYCSKDPSTKTGAIIVDKDGSILSTGYNGFPRRILDKQEDLDNREVKYRKIIHCEMNAAMFAGRKDLCGCTLYTYPFMSCSRCAAHMVQWGISRHVAPEVPEEAKERWAQDMGYAKEMFAEAKVAVAIYKLKVDSYLACARNDPDVCESVIDPHVEYEDLKLCPNCGCGNLNFNMYYGFNCSNCGGIFGVA